MIEVGIVGGAGYTAGELIRLLLNHEEATLKFVHSQSQAGKALAAVHKDLLGETDLVFEAGAMPAVDLLFMCLGHQRSARFLENNHPPTGTKIIDLSQDFRISKPGNNFVYGLPELHREVIRDADFVANPGCFATAIQLALLPLATDNLLGQPVHIHAITGSTGAGVQPLETTHFSWRQNNLSVYKPFQHQHLKEIRQSLSQAGSGDINELNFIPVRGNFTKGIFCTAYTEVKGSADQYFDLYCNYYKDHPFTWIASQPLSLKEVVNTNKCFLHLEIQDGKLLVTSILDNLIKGASGQAIQNMNLMFGKDERMGLRLKATGF